MKGRILLLAIVVFICFSCRNKSNKTSEFVFPEADSVPVSEAEKLSPEAIADISKNISSPVEIANLLQLLEIPFSQNYLATSIDANKQSTNFDKALKLGVLGADLGYLNMYEKTGSSLDVLSSIRKLAEDIKVGQFFNFESIKRLSQNKSNLDSLLFISIDSYTQIDNYLRKNDRGQLSALMIIGVWIEGQYLATQVVSQYPDTMLRDRIGEQKIILNDLLLLISPYCNIGPEFTALCKDMQDLKEKYHDVRITYTQGDPISVEKDGRLEITQTETSVVQMSKEQLESIIEITKNIRNRLILNN
ncbi:MAG: hypothetical protein EPN88_08550 [Bacteroidetes bacterium]|nr:MAG: hypothetical protein EPN88_08550 [Bacteroidota bacterium]